jgi:hypothetical protein
LLTLLFCSTPRHIESRYGGGAGGRIQQGRHNFDGCALAGTVWAKQAEDALMGNFQIKVIKRAICTKSFGQGLCCIEYGKLLLFFMVTIIASKLITCES